MASDPFLPHWEAASDFLEDTASGPVDEEAVAQLEREIIPWLRPSHEQQSVRPRKIHAQGALRSAEGFLRRGAPAGAPGPGHLAGTGTEIESQLGQLVEWAKASRRLIDPALAQRVDFSIGGVEHDVFHDEGTGRWLKITKPGRCGKAHFVSGEEVAGVPSALVLDDALPLDYLERLRLANANFGDDLRLHGVMVAGAGVRLVISQRHVPGESATAGQIARYFKDHGFMAVKEKTFYHGRENLLVSDAHRGNLLRVANGIIVAIDVIIQRPAGALWRAVTPREALSFDEEPEPGLLRL